MPDGGRAAREAREGVRVKKSIIKRLVLIIVVSMLVSLALNYYTRVKSAYGDELDNSQKLFWQIRQILKENEEDTEIARADFEQICLVRAKAAAYLVKYHPEMLDDQTEMKKVAGILQVDEFHIFDKDGNLYAGSEPKYFGLNFNSGEQMQFFLPMLQDKSLELCQEITPNTAEKKMMQYAAVWDEDGKEIVQIGMEPERVLAAMEKNELSYIFSLVTVDSGADIYAIDAKTHEIAGALDEEMQGEKAEDIGLDIDRLKDEKKLYTMEVAGKAKCIAFEESDSLILIRACDREEMFENINNNGMWLALYLTLLALAIIFSIFYYLDRFIIRSIASINGNLMRITEGNLEVTLPEQPTPELSELSSHVNEMVESILDSTNKVSFALDRVKIPIAMYEYTPGMKRVRVTNRMREVLNLAEEDAEIFHDYMRFEKWLREIQTDPVDPENLIFRLPGTEDRFVRMESFQYEKSTLGVVIDVTQDVLEKRSIEKERDVDLLTELFNRRAFYHQAEEILKRKQEIGYGAVMMADADNLKRVNDVYGHENGDRYLKEIARIIGSCGAPKQIAARLSGDEFAVFLYGCRSKAELAEYIAEILDERDASVLAVGGDASIPVRFSVGCAFYREDGETLRELLSVADGRMYQNKRMGKERK